MARSFLIISFLLIVAVRVVSAQVSVTGTVAATTVGTGERVIFTVEVQGADVANIEIVDEPWTSGLAPISRRPAISRSIDIVDGDIRTSVKYRWTFEPIERGRAAIGAVDVRVQNEDYRTDPINLTIVDPAQRLGSTDGRSTRSIVSGDVFIEGRANRDTVVVNEQVVVEYRLFYREGVQLRQSRMAGSWDTPGFWREEMDVDLRPHPDRRIVNGLPFNSIVLKRVATYPTRDGRLRIEPFRIESEVRARSGDPRDPFASYRNRFRTMEISSNAIEIMVRPLPSGAPASFEGAIGRFAFSDQPGASRIRTGDPFQITLQISGSGNLAMIDAPRVVLPESFDRFSPTESARIDRSGPRPTGRKTFVLTAVPTEPGEFVIPPIDFSYFNPDTWNYETLRTEPSTVIVEGEALRREGAFGAALGDVKTSPDWGSSRAGRLVAQPWAYAPLALPLAAWLLLPGAVRLRNSSRQRREHRLREEARRNLANKIAALRRKKPEYALRQVEQIMNSSPAELVHEDVRGSLRKKLESARYAPGPVRQQMTEDLLDTLCRHLGGGC
jgi:hypothetical protein